MTITLNRNKIFIIGLGIIALFVILNRIDYIFGSNVTEGEVVRMKTWYSRGSFSAPIIKFSAENYIVTFQGVTNMDVEVKEKVDVIYKIADPTNAEVYSFVGFWLTPMIYCIIPIMLLISVVFSFLTPTQTIIIDFNKVFKKTTDNEPPTIETKQEPGLDKTIIRQTFKADTKPRRRR